MPKEDEKQFKELLGELSFFNKLAEKGKGLFKSRDKALTHSEDCPCPECKRKNLNTYILNKEQSKYEGGRSG